MVYGKPDGPEETQSASPRRIQFLDALRGFSIILVVAYHLGYDLVWRGFIPEGALYNPVLGVLQNIFSGLFILLAGISSRFSRNNLKRGLILLACAAAVTLVSFLVLPDPELSWQAVTGAYEPAEDEVLAAPVLFGILHLLASCVLLYALLEKLRVAAPFVLLAAFLLPFFGVTEFPVIRTADYFPIVPWGFLFFLGVWLGGPIRDGAFPKRFYTAQIPVFPAIGRHTLLIYLLHQPVLYGVFWLAEALFPRSV
ncbi:MAG: DUF1624 domain-containing protein [Oscillospiraceae bacterium]|nr:DUF1624 domain-containing protein [Oscillospiraceae bacterium]